MQIEAVPNLGAVDATSDPDALGEFDVIFDTAGVFTHIHLLRDGGRIVTDSDDDIPASLAAHAASAKHSYVRHNSTVSARWYTRSGPSTHRAGPTGHRTVETVELSI
ncbi:hypothetical protein EF847_02805 [Actinobacteria bacterium YIM 96077]|uniref:Uncharacterized protein n=1 Tax=Phytoactinopolyspora halophila TaxID=1981511 RepID=A0A329QC52_9ACTN|nr:hypothetical protein EF847_02805 [Actinobacteria bacterium YIM 96077]RAW09827.1 hypothetical protein DPM12_19980 [Phytoactinopolyspora halophila]